MEGRAIPIVFILQHQTKLLINYFILFVLENFECKQCGKQFGNRHILQLHTRLHASQSSSTPPETGISDAVTVTSTTQTNGSLNINFNVSLNINLADGLDTMDLDSKLNDLLANATKASFHEALRREKKLACQLKSDVSEVSKSSDTSPSKSSDISEGELNAKSAVDSPPLINSSNDRQKVLNGDSPVPTAEEPPKPQVIPPPKPPVRVNPHNRRKYCLIR